jgi:ParB/RepB/Spo0J family partition protein
MGNQNGKTREKLADQLQEIPVDLIDADPWQSRTREEEAASLAGLAENIASQGMLEPVRVRPSRTHPGRWWCYAGFRRAAAQKELRKQDPERWAAIPCLVSPHKEDAEALLDSLSENVQRRELTALEVGAALLRLWEVGSSTQEQLAASAGLHPGYVRNLIAGARIALACPELVAVDREKPLPARLLKALPSDPELLRKIAELWREWGDGSIAPLLQRIEQLRRRESVEIPSCGGATRIELLRRCVRSLQELRDPDVWELGPVTPAERVESQRLQVELVEARAHLLLLEEQL